MVRSLLTLALLTSQAVVAGESSASVVDDKVGAWRVVCHSDSCNAYQYGVGGSKPTILRFEPGVEEAPQIRIEGGPFTPSGEVRFTIDGEWISGGLASTLGAESGVDLVLELDDITYGLARQMKVGKVLELTVPRGETPETVEFDLDGFTAALHRVTGD